VKARCFLAFLLTLAAAGAAAQGVYRWTDERGKVNYGSQPPPSAKASAVRERINSYGGPVQVDRGTGPQGAAARSTVMYATSWCGYCAQARAYFARKGIRYTEHDVEKSQSANAEFKKLGGKGVPLIVHNGEVMRGFSEASFEALLARTAAPASAR
jgi:glutaredoxin